jgi:hypothetical protein
MRYEPRPMLKKILFGLGALFAVFLIVVATRPATFEVKRSLLINAPAEVVYAQIDDFHAWDGWSPWAHLDPNMKCTYNDVPSGVGASYHWVGDKGVGEGNMKITEAKANEHVGIDLDFIAPFEAHNRTDIDLVKTGEGTTVTWLMSGKNNFGAKAASLFMNMDKMVGGDFEKGLAAMKTISETEALKKAAEAKKTLDDAAPADAGTP